MKIVRIVLIAAGALVVLVVLGLAILVATFDPNKFKPEIALAVKDKTGRTLAMDGSIGLSLFPDIGVSLAKVSLSEPDSSRLFARIENARVSLALLPLLSRQVVVDGVTLTGLSADLVKHKDGKTNFEDLVGPPGGTRAPARRDAKAPAASAPQLEIAGIEVRSSSIGWHDEASGARYKVSVAELKTGRIASGVPGRLTLAARVEATEPKTDLQLDLATGYRVDLERKSVALSGLELKIADGAGGSAPAVSMKGDIEFELSSQATRFKLAVDRLNLDRYLPPPAKAGAAKGAEPAQPPSDQPVDLSGLRALNVNGTLKVGELVASNVKVEALEVGLQAAGGRVQLKPLSAKLYQGSFSGDAALDASGNHVVLRGKLQDVAIGPLLKDALANDLLEGRGDMTLDVQTAGATVAAMKKALSGSAGLSLRDAALKGVNLDELARKARELSGRPAAEPAAGAGGRTDFSEVTASFVIRGGVAHNEDLSAKSPLLRVAGSGDVDIGSDAIDYVARASLVASASGQGGADAESLRGITVPVKITGALEAPKFHADLGAAVGGAVRQRAEERLKDEVTDRLKGLLRR